MATPVTEKPQAILKIFINTLLHKHRSGLPCLEDRTFAVVHVHSSVDPDTDIWFVRRNTLGKHAEIHVLDKLRKYMGVLDSSAGTLTVTCYLNYSPCFECCSKIKEFCQDPSWHNNMKFHIVFAALYMIRRPSCRYTSTSPWETASPRCSHELINRLPEPTSDEHILGLYGLKETNCIRLRTFTAGDWEMLIRYLVLMRGGNQDELSSEWEDYRALREEEDLYMQFDLQLILERVAPLVSLDNEIKPLSPSTPQQLRNIQRRYDEVRNQERHEHNRVTQRGNDQHPQQQMSPQPQPPQPGHVQPPQDLISLEGDVQALQERLTAMQNEIKKIRQQQDLHEEIERLVCEHRQRQEEQQQQVTETSPQVPRGATADVPGLIRGLEDVSLEEHSPSGGASTAHGSSSEGATGHQH